ncbi:unnamed protein product, partial [Ectocarpus sp. 4 AP-2014]
ADRGTCTRCERQCLGAGTLPHPDDRCPNASTCCSVGRPHSLPVHLTKAFRARAPSLSCAVNPPTNHHTGVPVARPATPEIQEQDLVVNHSLPFVSCLQIFPVPNPSWPPHFETPPHQPGDQGSGSFP